MKKTPSILAYILLLIICVPICATEQSDKAIKEWPLARLEARLHEIDDELTGLAELSLRSGVGAIGYRSYWQTDTDIPVTVEIELDQEQPIDAIVLVPTIWRTMKHGFQSDSFPLEFQISAGSKEDRAGQIIAHVNAEAEHLPRIAPLIIPISNVTASWIRIETIRLSKRYYDNLPCIQLAEVLIFNGVENVALKRPTTASSTDSKVLSGAWNTRFLVDGHMPYLMNSTRGKESRPFVSSIAENVDFIIDLGEKYPLTGMHIHTIDQSDTVPQGHTGDLGIPRLLKVVGASDSEFTTPLLLTEHHKNSLHDVGPIIMHHFPKQSVRFVKLSAEGHGSMIGNNSNDFRSGFAEIEFFANGENVARNKTVQAEFIMKQHTRPLSALTDGSNLYGELLPIRQWMEELAQRHELERERPLIIDELNKRYAQQKQRLRIMTGTVVVFAIGIGFLVLIERHLRLKNAVRIKQRIAANLHDELGANLHAIGMLGRVAQQSANNTEAVDRICEIAERTSNATRHCTNLLESNIIGENIADEIRRDSARLLAGLEHTIDIQGEAYFERVKNRRRIDLILFNKECLANIVRHSQATKISTHLSATKQVLTLTIQDNGTGTTDHVPPSLLRRAKLMKAKTQIEHPPEGGTSINLTLKLRTFGSFL